MDLMLAGYAMHGRGKEAIEFFERVVKEEGINPDHVTFTHLLSACSHSGLVMEGKYYFKIMFDVYKVQPRSDHYSCMVDLLGRCGLLNEAHELIKNMPFEPNSGVWGFLLVPATKLFVWPGASLWALGKQSHLVDIWELAKNSTKEGLSGKVLGACRVHRNIDLGKEAAENLIALDPRNYITLSNMYSAAGLWSHASKVRALMKAKVVTQNPGCSFIEHGNKIHRFVVDDYTHPD
ncbi:unnamed protein product [Trifolium pratense]|uniref:Uncharacterized protein n=1 Tax=Trifolium pratense TaxID=57577 RepID=A0ACB0IIC4_TRIPR|nr:unnamed protein product [Trifolium pratense]